MIDISKNVIHTYINERSCKKFSQTSIYSIWEKQMRSVFLNYLKHKSKKENIYFTKNTIERVLKMDISKVEPSSLSFLGEKYNKEFSFCFLEKENISFCFSIDLNSVKFIVFNGNQKSLTLHQNENFVKSEIDYSPTDRAVVGSGVINFSSNELSIFPSSPIYFVKDEKTKEYFFDPSNIGKIPKDYLEILTKAIKNEIYFKNLQEDFFERNGLIFLAIKCFLFLKTATVIDKTFISENKKFKIKSKFGISKENNEYTIINSFFDESINVLNPFSVSGHFRNQPKKNGVEIIYIDSFMKQGYKRPAKILLQSDEISSKI